MYISSEQINAVVEALIDNEFKIGDGYAKVAIPNDVLKEVAEDIIKKLNKVIYSGT